MTVMLSTGTSSIQGSDSSVEQGSRRNRPSIFATPPEPLFNHAKTGLCPELIQESLLGLAKLNEKLFDSENSRPLYNCFQTKSSASFFFLTCQYLNLPIDIQYRAIDLFVRFMSKHVTELYAHVQSTRNSHSPIDWSTVQDRLTHQVTLRAVTCIQLASKMSLHYKIVSISKARSFLSQCGYHYAANSLVQSEIRVLKTLDFRVHNPSLLDYIEIILEALGYNDPTIKVKQLHGVCVKVLEVFYMTSKDLSDAIHFQIIKDSPSSQTHNGNNITGDLLLTSSSIIGAAAFILNQTSSDEVVQAISQITCIEANDILDFASLLIKKIMTT